MRWYSVSKYRPVHTGDIFIIVLKSGYIHTGVFDYQKDVGYFFENEEHNDRYLLNDVTHFAIPDPVEIE